MNKQLKEKDGNAFKDVFPINIIQNIKDGDTGKTLQSILKSFNSIFIEYKNNVEDTRNSIDESIRRKGLWVTYLPTGEQDYVTEVYIGNEESILNNWADNSNWKKILNVDYNSTVEGKIPNGIITMEKLSPALQELLKQNNNIINYPDDEDLQADYGYLQFKDRKYNPDLASGKGYKILRKNWLGVNNVLTQDMINEENTIYVIRYDFDLNGKEITIPEGCILQFEGGSLSNGVLNCINTRFNNEDDCVFINIIFKGVCLNTYANSKWFNLIGDDISVDIPLVNEHKTLELISSFINICINLNFEFEQRTYGFGFGDFIPQKDTLKLLWYGYFPIIITNTSQLKSITINGNNSKFINLFKYYVGCWKLEDGVMIPNYNNPDENYSYYTNSGGFIYSNKLDLNISILNLNVDMRREIFNYGGIQKITQSLHVIQLETKNGNVYINNVNVSNALIDGLFIYCHNTIEISNSTMNGNIRAGASILSGKDIKIKNCNFINNGQYENIPNYNFEKPNCGLNIEVAHFVEDKVENVNIENTLFKNSRSIHLTITGNVNNVNVDKCFFESDDKLKLIHAINIFVNNTARITNNTFYNSWLGGIYIKKESGNKGIVENSYCYTTIPIQNTEPNRSIVIFTNSNINKYNGCIYKNTNIFLHNKYVIECGNSDFNDDTIIKDLNIHLLSSRTEPIIYYWRAKKANVINIYDYVPDSDIIKSKEDNNIISSAEKINIISMLKDKTKHTIIFSNRINPDGDTTFNTYKLSPLYCNYLKLHTGSYSLYNIGTFNTINKQNMKTERCLHIFDYKNYNQRQCLFCIKDENYYDDINYGFKKFTGRVYGIPHKYINDLNVLQRDITDENLAPLIGDNVYHLQLKKQIYFDGSKWLDIMGNPIDAIKQGTTQQRPVDVKAGFYYFDTTLNKPIWKKEDTGIIWVDATGAEV